ncbi:MAG: hypothetical protein R3E73_02910 [Porticoccaceae bacterium]|nr:hypothetical protein [Pseudomonadales bacterium]MCP5172840.1 hypothetical protein [Pseudomonadales bacterium]MCP5302314.1 hypothetical protein [Pseudomonadales bacterium]
MTSFLIKNCNRQYLAKDLTWVPASTCHNSQPLFHTPFRDVALNQLVELNTKDFQLRAEVVNCELDEKNRPIIPQQEAAA